ncbi:MAG: hypothetical protein ACON5A_02265 [Candidatus Comchoanobacterales bacterium]
MANKTIEEYYQFIKHQNFGSALDWLQENHALLKPDEHFSNPKQSKYGKIPKYKQYYQNLQLTHVVIKSQQSTETLFASQHLIEAFETLQEYPSNQHTTIISQLKSLIQVLVQFEDPMTLPEYIAQNKISTMDEAIQYGREQQHKVHQALKAIDQLLHIFPKHPQICINLYKSLPHLSPQLTVIQQECSENFLPIWEKTFDRDQPGCFHFHSCDDWLKNDKPENSDEYIVVSTDNEPNLVKSAQNRTRGSSLVNQQESLKKLPNDIKNYLKSIDLDTPANAVTLLQEDWIHHQMIPKLSNHINIIGIDPKKQKVVLLSQKSVTGWIETQHGMIVKDDIMIAKSWAEQIHVDRLSKLNEQVATMLKSDTPLSSYRIQQTIKSNSGKKLSFKTAAEIKTIDGGLSQRLLIQGLQQNAKMSYNYKKKISKTLTQETTADSSDKENIPHQRRPSN